MTWAKVDDKLHSSVKWRRASKGARALWATALSWCSDQENDGRVPPDMLRTLDGTNAEAKSLVAAGLWDDHPEGGWAFHDWQDYNPDSASQKAKREAESKGGRQGNHTRWHAKKGVVVPGCEWCVPGTSVGTSAVQTSVQTSARDMMRTDATLNTDPRGGILPSQVNTASSGTRSGPDRRAESPPNPPDPYPYPYSGGRLPEPPTGLPVPEMLEAAGLPPEDHNTFLQSLRDHDIKRPAGYVMRAYHDDTLKGRIQEWRDEVEREAKAPRVITSNTTKAPRDDSGRAVYEPELCEHGGAKGSCPMCKRGGKS